MNSFKYWKKLKIEVKNCIYKTWIVFNPSKKLRSFFYLKTPPLWLKKFLSKVWSRIWQIYCCPYCSANRKKRDRRMDDAKRDLFCSCQQFSTYFKPLKNWSEMFIFHEAPAWPINCDVHEVQSFFAYWEICRFSREDAWYMTWIRCHNIHFDLE